MSQIYFDDAGDLSVLEGKVLSIIGYGNQGSAQAHNFRDSGISVVVGNARDASFEAAARDGFPTYEVAEAVQKADIHFLLLPDEVMPAVFASAVRPHLKDGQAVVVASGYNVTYGFIRVPDTIDLLMIAPRMIGTGVRNGYVEGRGFPSLVSVEHDASGKAQERLLALAKGVGTLKGGAVASNCDEETLCDLFNEHFGYVYALRRAYELLVEAGASPEAALLEFWASGEEMELARVHVTHGLFHQLGLHSQVSQYGQEVTSRLSVEDEERERNRLRQIIARIKDGSFAREWALEQQAGLPVWRRVRHENYAHPMIKEEERLLSAMGVLERPVGAPFEV
ncbi:MAG: NAD(P)-binding domain-containing protein [Chloroflexota bacterium]